MLGHGGIEQIYSTTSVVRESFRMVLESKNRPTRLNWIL